MSRSRTIVGWALAGVLGVAGIAMVVRPSGSGPAATGPAVWGSNGAGGAGGFGPGMAGTPMPINSDPLGSLLPESRVSTSTSDGADAAASGSPTSGGSTSGGPTSGGPTSGGPTSGGPTSGGPTSGGSAGTAESPSPAATLITNEYAFNNPGSADAVRSPDWMVTSGSLFSAGGLLWSGRPDGHAPDPTSRLFTDSAVLRAVTTRSDHADVAVSFALRVVALGQTPRTPSQDTDGVHVFLHYQSEFSTYYVSMFRRDGQVAIKKKVPGGPSNGGTYYTLAAKAYPVEPAWPAAWHQVEASIARVGPGAVRLTLRIDGQAALDVTDDGASAPIIGDPGRVGLRGDNCEFYVRDFRAEPLAEH